MLPIREEQDILLSFEQRTMPCLLMKQEHPCVSFARHTTHPYCEVVYLLPQDLALVLWYQWFIWQDRRHLALKTGAAYCSEQQLADSILGWHYFMSASNSCFWWDTHHITSVWKSSFGRQIDGYLLLSLWPGHNGMGCGTRLGLRLLTFSIFCR